MINKTNNTAENTAAQNKTEYVKQLENEVSELKEELQHSEELISNLKKMLFGRKSEKTEYVVENGAQLSLFNEAEQDIKEPEETVVVEKHERKKKRSRKEMESTLPVKEEVISLPEDQQICEKCGGKLTVIGREKIADKVVIIPRQAYIERTVVETYACESCGKDGSADAASSDITKRRIVKAPAPVQAFPGSLASPESAADVIYQKFVNAVPLYRQESDLAGCGLYLSRQTLSGWIQKSADRYLEPLCVYMKAELLKEPVIQADETPVQVLHEEGKTASSKSYMWVFASGEFSGRKIVLFNYEPNRKAVNAGNFLGDYSGKIVCDGYDGYAKVKAVRCGCFAHLRRRFLEGIPSGTAEFRPEKVPFWRSKVKDEAERYSSKDELLTELSDAPVKSSVGFWFCNELFALEKEFRDLTAEDRYIKRQAQSKLLLDAFWSWVDSLNPIGKTKLASAVGYAKGERRYLSAFIDDPLVPISNNHCERSIRPFTIGRGNWIFCNTPAGAKASAAAYSIVETAIAAGLNPYQYLLYIFKHMPELSLFCREKRDFGSLMPWDEMVRKECSYLVGKSDAGVATVRDES